MWKIDNIDLRSYGVGIMSTRGILDAPAIYDVSNNWLDENGRDFWQLPEDVKFRDREIMLNCFLRAGDYDDFKSKLSTFYTAITAPGLRSLQPPFGSAIDCFVEQQIIIDRKTSYIQPKQVGVFTLRLTVPGDVNALPLRIRRWTGVGNVDVATIHTTNLKVKKTLQGDIYATFSFVSAEKLSLKYFDFIEVNSNGAYNERFHLSTEPAFRKLSTNKYVYDLRMEHQSAWLYESQFLNLDGEADFYLHANMQEVVDLIIDNHNRSWWENFSAGTIEQTERHLHKFSAEDCYTVLRRLCQFYDLEYEFEFVTFSKYRINVKERVASTKAVTLEYGKGNGLYEITRDTVQRNEIVTVLYAFGSSKNIKPGYRGGLRRLSFSGNPLKNNNDLYAGAGPKELTVYFEDIYPHRTGTVGNYEQLLPEEMTAAELYVSPEGQYKMKDTSIDFDLNDYLLGGLSAKLRMKTGDLAGFEFEILRYDHDEKTIWLIPFKDERGELLPNETLTIGAGDEYTLVDIDMPESYYTAAEAELEAAAQAHLANVSVPRFPYRVRIDPAFMQENPGGFEIGDRITVIDADFGINGLFRVSDLEFDRFTGVYQLLLSDTARLTRRQQLELRIEAVERSLESTRRDEAESTRRDTETTGELRRRLIDPLDDKLKVDNIIRNESIDPRMLSWDAGIPQWFLKGALVETDVGGDYNKVNVGAGIISVANDPTKTLERYEIQKIKDDDGDYDPTRSWVIAETTITLDDDAAHFVYAKIDISENSTDCEIVITPDRIEPKAAIEDSYIFYEMGTIPEAEEL